MAKFHLLNFVRATKSDNCFAATKQAYQSVFIDSSPHCLTAPKKKKKKKLKAWISSESYFMSDNDQVGQTRVSATVPIISLQGLRYGIKYTSFQSESAAWRASILTALHFTNNYCQGNHDRGRGVVQRQAKSGCTGQISGVNMFNY